jgi:hypothetical protein
LNKPCSVPMEELLDYVDRRDGRVHDAQPGRIEAHLATGCAACESRLAELSRVLTAMSEAAKVSAPESAIERARSIYRERFAPPAKRSLLARLVFDSRQNLAFAGARGAEGATVQSLFSTEEHDIDLWQEQTPEGPWYIIGQVMPKAGGGPLVPDSAQLHSGGVTAATATRESDEFHLSAIAPGLYELRIAVGDAEIVLPEVAVGIETA